MYPLVRSVRLVEALGEYRRVGLSLRRYLRCRNFALAHFLPDLLRMLLRPTRSGLGYIAPLRVVAGNLIYPNFYLSPIIDKVRRVAAARGRVIG